MSLIQYFQYHLGKQIMEHKIYSPFSFFLNNYQKLVLLKQFVKQLVRPSIFKHCLTCIRDVSRAGGSSLIKGVTLDTAPGR